MRRFASITLIPLFALFWTALPGSAAATTGTAPTVSGGSPPVIGAVLTATPAVPGDSLAWETCAADGTLSGNGYLATGSTYTLMLSDAGTYVCAVELDPTGTLVLGSSGPVGPVEGLPTGAGPTLTADSQPIAGGQTLVEGQSLGVIPGAWGPASEGISISDDWWRCDQAGANCTGVAPGVSAYPTTRADVGSMFFVVETATATSNGASSFAVTPPTGVVSATPPIMTSPPTVSGTAQVGDTLTAAPGSWSNQPTSYTYQWERCSSGTCSAIPGARSSTYVPVKADVGDVLVVNVAGAIDPGTAYGAVGSAYPSYPTSPVVGVASSPPPSPGPAPPPVAPVAPAPPSVAPSPHPHRVRGRLTATMQWTFRYAPTYTQVLALAVEGPAVGSTIATRCIGRGCPKRVDRITVKPLRRCPRTRRPCGAPRTLNLEWEFGHHRLGVGTRVAIRITRPFDIGKYYRFVVRARQAPSVKISCLAPGSASPGKRCTGL